MTKSLYKVAKFFMVPAGLWKIPISMNPQIQKMYSIYSKCIQLNYILYSVSMIIRLKEMIHETNLDQLFTDITLAILILEINYKVIMFLKNGIPNMFFIIIERENNILSGNDPGFASIYLKQVKYYKMATFCQCFCSGFAITWFVVVNLYKKLVIGMLPNENFMYQLWFPFDKKKHDIFVTLYNVSIAVCGFFFNCGVQTTLQTLMVFSTSQLRILQLKLRNSFKGSSRKAREEETVDEIKTLIKEHQFLIEFITNLNEAIKYVILFEFALESLNGAGALLQVIMVKKTIDIPYSLIYLVLLFINLLVLAWSSNEILIQSSNVANAIYDSNWVDQNEETKKILFIMLMRAQEPLSIQVGPFRAMDAQAALLTMKGSYTYAQVVMHTRS